MKSDGPVLKEKKISIQTSNDRKMMGIFMVGRRG